QSEFSDNATGDCFLTDPDRIPTSGGFHYNPFEHGLRVFGDLIEFLHCGGYFQDLRRIFLDCITDYQNIRSGLAHLAGLTPISDSSSYYQWNIGILLDLLDHSLADRLLRSAARVQIYDPQ